MLCGAFFFSWSEIPLDGLQLTAAHVSACCVFHYLSRNMSPWMLCDLFSFTATHLRGWTLWLIISLCSSSQWMLCDPLPHLSLISLYAVSYFLSLQLNSMDGCCGSSALVAVHLPGCCGIHYLTRVKPPCMLCGSSSPITAHLNGMLCEPLFLTSHFICMLCSSSSPIAAHLLGWMLCVWVTMVLRKIDKSDINNDRYRNHHLEMSIW